MIGQKGAEALADAYNESGCCTSIKQFIKVTKRYVDPDLAELYRFPLEAVAIECRRDAEETRRRLKDSSLKPETKKAIHAFLSRLDGRGLRGLQIQYHVTDKLSELPALDDVTENGELIEVGSCGGESSCYLSATRIGFAFSGRQKMSAVFSQDGLSQLISRLQGIHDEGSKAVTRYKGAMRDLPGGRVMPVVHSKLTTIWPIQHEGLDDHA